MKLFFVLSFVVLSSQAMSAEVLLKLSRGSGFSPFPRSTSLVITDSGEVFKHISERRLVRKVAVAQLSPVALSTLKEKIESIADDAVLINIDAKRPPCMDAPSTSLKVNKGGKEIEIAAVRSCQRHQSEDLETEDLLALAQSFDYLSE